MTLVAGIDLGTTNCCVAIPADADIPNKQALIDRRRLRQFGSALIVANPDLSLTTPSAIWISPDGTVLVGALAKRKARHPGSPPAMFFKRNMGTDQPVTAGHATITPLQASVHLLRHLKTMAQDVLGVPIDRAVITVPAYFETSAKTQTGLAGAEAGLEVVETLMEPVAAALAHMHEYRMKDSEGRRFLIYDLGGGTFDTSVVSWDPDGGFSSRSFDGNRYLGGYDFDQAIVDWMIAQLPGYDLGFRPDQPRDAELLARLLSLAEAAKHELSRETETEIISQDLEDRSGNPMTINLPISRPEFDRMIEDHLRATLDHCAEALAKARLSDAALDEIVLVGGSSRIPLVATLLEQRFGIPPRLFHPELVVAVGAALKAASRATRSSVLELEPLVPQGDSVDIAGRVRCPDELGQPVLVLVETADGAPLEQRVNGDGAFLFIDVPLVAEGESSFTVRVLAAGQQVDTGHLTVTAHDETPALDLAGDVLAHDFSVELVDGRLARIVKAGTKIPHRVSQHLETARAGTALRVRLYEGRIPIGSVQIHDLPEDVAPGTAVELSLEFAVGWTIHASVRLPQLDRAATAVIDIPVRQVASWTEIRSRTARAHAAWRQVRPEVHQAESAKAGPDLEQRLVAVEGLIVGAKDQAKAHHMLLEAETILQTLQESEGPEAYLEPPLADFEDRMGTLTNLVVWLERDLPGEAQPFRYRQDGVAAEARAAYEAGDFTAWRRANEKLDDLVREVVRTPLIREILAVGASPTEYRAWLTGEIETADQLIRRKYDTLLNDPRLASAEKSKLPTERDLFLGELQLIAATVRDVDLSRPAAREHLHTIYTGRLQPLHARVERWGRETGIRWNPGVA
ncbi:Hsp70 family protein [Nocardia rosealba]|uniref:Hsp70 family protein n=1 Tax=Nocardia rosealba TaxID=2878563 RepID=UPI001CD96381|nr:Hsp70 family protein [Nocardia rosealba]MCA2206915.1 Hsp70 family protein [Nocardia rosealba]